MKKILVVDDNGIFLRNMKNLLEPEYETILVNSGERAVAVARVRQPDLILLDHEMPEFTGKQTLLKLREHERTKDIPVIFLTGVSDTPHILELLNLRPQGYVLKPVEPTVLLKKIVEVMK